MKLNRRLTGAIVTAVAIVSLSAAVSSNANAPNASAGVSIEQSTDMAKSVIPINEAQVAMAITSNDWFTEGGAPFVGGAKLAVVVTSDQVACQPGGIVGINMCQVTIGAWAAKTYEEAINLICPMTATPTASFIANTATGTTQDTATIIAATDNTEEAINLIFHGVAASTGAMFSSTG